MLGTALEFSKDICDHINVLLSMYIVKILLICAYLCYYHNHVESEISAYFLYVLAYLLS